MAPVADKTSPMRQRVASVQARADVLRDRGQRTLVWQVWGRMLETEFVDRSVAMAGKAFVSFFPLVIVVAAFLPHALRTSVLSTMTHRLGVRGHALTIAKEALSSSEDVRRATGIMGLILTFFFASSFTTALQRVYLRAWRRTAGGKVGAYTRGPAWLAGMIGFMALLGAIRSLFGDGAGILGFMVVSLTLTTAWWWFTAWFMLLGQVRWRVLLPTAVITSVTMGIFATSALVWMPNVVTRNELQFGFFGVALALVTWFSGAASCVIVAACAGPVLAEDPGWLGRLVRGGNPDVLVEGATPSLPAPTHDLRLRDAFRPVGEEATPE